MLFNSLQFIAFFVVVTILYYVLSWKWRWKMLLLASCVFYMAFIPAYIAILLITILIDYYMGIKIAEATEKRRLLYLQISIVSTCLVLFIFKYCGFFEITVRELQALLGVAQTFPITHIILPIGLSFHTFQSLSYVIEVYRGNQKPERHFGIYALYVMFYPQLVAGPIERPQNLLHQFYEEHRFDVTNITRGLSLILWGFFQKMVIADRCAVYVNNVYRNPSRETGLALTAATVLFAVQIYADFAGYSSIAIGCARVMGFKLMTNFNRPYFARSFAEFWKRWHISLSTWFRDYIYIPLGGNRVPKARLYFNLLLTFTISGLWHGANWTFVIWGALNGLFLVVESILAGSGHKYQDSVVRNALRRTIVIVGICISWVFFRAQSLHDAIYILKTIFTKTSFSTWDIGFAVSEFAHDITSIPVGITTILLVVLMFAIELGQESGLEHVSFFRNIWVQHQLTANVALLEMILLFGMLRASAFVYFQF